MKTVKDLTFWDRILVKTFFWSELGSKVKYLTDEQILNWTLYFDDLKIKLKKRAERKKEYDILNGKDKGSNKTSLRRSS